MGGRLGGPDRRDHAAAAGQPGGAARRLRGADRGLDPGRPPLPAQALENEPDINDNVGRLVGKEGVAVTGFINGEGRVFIDGKEWAAVTETGAPLPLLDQKIEVTEAKGSILRVKAA